MARRSRHGRGRSRRAARYPIYVFVVLPALLMTAAAIWFGFSAPTSPATSEQIRSAASQTSNGANKPSDTASMFQLRAAVRAAPRDGEARARLGIALMRTGQRVAAERELRQAIDPVQSDIRPVETVVPNLLRVMLQRNEMNELLNQFPEPTAGIRLKVAADIMSARAFALQTLHRPVEARTAMDRSLALRRDVEGLAASASLAQQQGKMALARSQTSEVIKLAPDNEGARLRSIQLARESGDMRQALANADEFVRRVPGSLIARALRIEVLLELDEEERAKADVAILLRAAPAYGKFYNAVVTAQNNDIQGAWTQLQTLQPEFIQAQAYRAMAVADIATAAGRVNSGVAILTTFVARHPDDRLARLKLAAARLTQNEPQAALDALSLVTVGDPMVHALRAQAYLQLQEFAEAIEEFEDVSALPKINNLLKPRLTLSQFQVGESDEIIRGFRSLLKTDPDNVAGAGPLIAALMAACEWDDAFKVANEIAKRAPKSPLPDFYLGQIFIARGELTDAKAAFDKTLAIAPNFVPALYYRANVSVVLRKPEEAKADFGTLLAQNAANVLASIRMAEIALDNSRDNEASTLLEHTQLRFVTSAAPRLALANYEIERGKYHDAEATLNALLNISNNNPYAQALQGEIQLLTGHPADAAATFRALINGNIEQMVAYTFIARALYASKDQAGAEEAVKKGIELAPDSVQLQRALADIQKGGSKSDDVVSAARTYENENPGLEADLLLADVLLDLKRTSEADVLIEKFLRERPPSRFIIRLSEEAAKSGNPDERATMLSKWISKYPEDLVVQHEYAGLPKKSDDASSLREPPPEPASTPARLSESQSNPTRVPAK
jgi:putative PEP-CTERM system TPR-repeat lipoprotein